tara:strand:- start:9737 stop:10297 length:561 start_codon:yes stop_codon:yes gene_type:complete
MILLKKLAEQVSNEYATELLYKTFYNMPEYVFNDFVMSKNGFFQKEFKRLYKQNPDIDEDELEYEFEDWVNIKWKLKVLTVNPSDFTKNNQKTMISRKFGDLNPNNVPDDEERTEFQRKLAKKLKPGTNEPVIVLSKGTEYRLLEGWHRTMAILSLGNNGETDPTKWNRVKIKAYVGTGSSVKNVW